MVRADYRPGLTVRARRVRIATPNPTPQLLGETISAEPYLKSRNYHATVRWRNGVESIVCLARLEIL